MSFSNCGPPHGDLTCTVIQGGMDSNSPRSNVAQALKQRGEIIGTEWRSQVGQQLAAQRTGFEQNKEILAQGRRARASRCQGAEGRCQDTLCSYGHTDISDWFFISLYTFYCRWPFLISPLSDPKCNWKLCKVDSSQVNQFSLCLLTQPEV